MPDFFSAWKGLTDQTFPRCVFNEYSYNKNNLYGYRSDEFEGFIDNKKYLITLGDSWCYGAGIPDFKKTWNFLLKEKLNCDKIYNLGTSGTSIDNCARLLTLFLNKYIPTGQKIYLVCMFPSTMRREFFEDSGKHIHNITSKEFLGNKNPINTIANLFIYRTFFKNEYNNLDRFLRNFSVIETLCKVYNIHFIWTDWRKHRQLLPDATLDAFYRKFCSIKNSYIDINTYLTESCIDFIPVSDTDGHPGESMQPIVAKLIFDFLNNAVKIKSNNNSHRKIIDYEYSQKFEEDYIKAPSAHLS